MALAVSHYRSATGLSDDDDTLGLSWTSDERGVLAVDLDELLRRSLADEVTSRRRAVDLYPVDDPYGERVVRSSVEAWTGCEVGVVVAGAGVGSLLHALAVGASTDVLVVGSVYPDFPHWLRRRGRRVRWRSSRRLLADASAIPSAGTVFLERPSLLGDSVDCLSDLREICERAAAQGAVVVIDESNANYEPPRYSAANVLGTCENLVVLRGLSKAYGLGGLRVGLALAADASRTWLTDAIPPLQASPQSLRIASVVLDHGDVAARLRQRVASHKSRGAPWLEAVTGVPPVPGHRGLPYWLLPPAPRTVRLLNDRGVVGKRHACWEGAGGDDDTMFYRLSVPLAPTRFDRLRTLCAGT